MAAIITPELAMNKFVEGLFNQRAGKKIQKEGLHAVAEFWYDEIFPIHFTDRALNKYPGEYIKKKSKGPPMVKTGQMKKNVFSNKRITGTPKQARLRFGFGVPRPKTQKQLKSSAWYIANRDKIEFKRALRKVALSQGNYGKHVAQFKIQASAVDAADIIRMASFMKAFVIGEYNKGRKGSRKRKAKRV